MTVKIYASRDSEGRAWPPDHKHEAQSTIEIVKNLWRAYHDADEPFSVVANAHQPSADLVVLSRRGIGIVELKHYPGRIRREGKTWYARQQRIKAGSESKGYRNPHEQVQSYATKIRHRLIGVGRDPWLPGRLHEQEAFTFNTAVCFTHPDAHVANLKDSIRCSPVNARPWEDFDVLTPSEVPGWTAALRFEVDKGRSEHYEPYCLTGRQITRIAEDALGGTEWAQIAELMPTGEPYGYLTLIEGDQRMQTFSLDRESLTLGRDADILIPEQFGRVSREHAQIKRTLDGVMIEDLDSRNKTYVNGAPVRGPCRLKHRTKITLGGPEPSLKVCLLVFTRNTPIEPGMTEAATGVG